MGPEVVVTEKLRESFQKLILCDSIPNDLKKLCETITEKKATHISTKTIRRIHRLLQDNGFNVYLHDLLEGADLYLPELSQEPRNPELEARIQRLKAENENKEYERMTRNVSRKNNTNFTFRDDVKAINSQLVGIINFIVTVGAGFTFGYKGTEFLVGKIFPMQMMSGLIVATIIFFVDLYFMLRYGF